jgi:hypothetical protein
MIDEKNLPFLDLKTEMGPILRESVIDSNMDDDVMTDEDLAEGAVLMLHRSLKEAIKDFVSNDANSCKI